MKVAETILEKKKKGNSRRKNQRQAAKVKAAPQRRSRGKKKLTQKDRQELILEFRIKARKLGRSILRKWHARLDLQEVDSLVDLSLCEAVKRFDPTKGASFMTFLYYHLKGNLVRAVASAANANLVPQAEEEEGEEKKGNTVHAAEVAEALSGEAHALPDEVLMKKQLINLSQDARTRLDPLEQEVIHRIYIKGQQLMDIAQQLGYSRCHISRVKKKALETLQDDLTRSLEALGKEKVQDAVDAQENQSTQRRRPRTKRAREVFEEAAA